jgi:hypothetical protein
MKSAMAFILFLFLEIALLSSCSAFGVNNVAKECYRNPMCPSNKRLPMLLRRGRLDLLHLATNDADVADDSEGKIKSAALEWMSEQRRQLEEEEGIEGEPIESFSSDENVAKGKKKFVVVGGGWAGWGAAKTLCQCAEIDAHVILLDALPDPTGKTPYLSKTGKPVEAGTRGFWVDYPNINALCKELGLNEDDVFTPFTNSSFYS